jgi:competence protein ComEC
MRPSSLAHRAPLAGLVAAWALGSVASHAGWLRHETGVFAVALALAGLALAWAAGRGGETAARRRALLGGLALAVAAAGALRTGQERGRPAEWDALELPPREARLTLRIERLFAPAEGQEDAAGGFARVVGAERHLRDLTGQRIQFFTTWPAEAGPPLRGAEFTALGLLRPVAARPVVAADGDDFDRFIADSGANFAFSRARIEGGPKAAGAWSRFCAAAGARLEAILRAGLERHPAMADLYVAMMLGKKQELGEERKDWFMRSGTMHLFAISGLHIAGIAVALNTLLALARVPPLARFATGTALLWVFVETTGAAPSAVRAFWMVTFLLGAKRLRLPGNSLAALAASALVVLVLDPHQLFGAGFQMSYGIVGALLLYGVPLYENWHAGWRPGAGVPAEGRPGWRVWLETTPPTWVMSVLALGLAATLVSVPATVTFFGLMTPGGFFVNLVLVPVAGLVLFAGVGAMVCGLAGLAPLASVFNHAAAVVLWAMEGLVRVSLEVPGNSWPAAFAWPWLGPATMAGLLALLAAGYARGWRKREGGYWMPWAVLGLVLVLGLRGV